MIAVDDTPSTFDARNVYAAVPVLVAVAVDHPNTSVLALVVLALRLLAAAGERRGYGRVPAPERNT